MLAAVALASAHALGQGPISPLYLEAGGTMWVVQGTTASSSNNVSSNEYNLAVDGDIRTTQYRGSGDGYQYGLNGVATGTSYGGTWLGFFDGTTDGSSNYTLDYDTGNVWAFDRNWQNGSNLFQLSGGSGGYLGITYDDAGGLWVSQWDGTNIQHYSMNGTLLGQFSTGINDMTCLALDPANGTLWFGSQTVEGTFWNYSTSGTLLGSESYSNLVGVNALGGEFNVTAAPEPASMAALVGGIALLVRRRRR